MTPKNNTWKRTAVLLTIITLIIGMFVFFESTIDNKIAAHPDITALKVNQNNIKRQLDRIEDKLDDALKDRIKQ